MTSDIQYEKMYNDLVAGLEKMHKRNVSRTRTALKSLLIIPTFFLIMLFMAQGNKTVFLILWIASMFIIAGILIIIEYQDYLLRQMFADVDIGKNDDDDEPIADEAPDEEASRDEALILAEKIRKSIQMRSPEFDVKEADEPAPEAVEQDDSNAVDAQPEEPEAVSENTDEALSNT